MFNYFLTKFDLESIEANPYVYISKIEPSLIIRLFVDDGLAACSSPTPVQALIHYIKEHLATTRSSAD